MSEYQLTIDDVERTNNLRIQPGRTAYIDESGSFGFDFSKPHVSTHYIVCAVIVNNEKIPDIERKIDELRRNYFGTGEMKSSSIGKSHSRRAKVLTELLQLDISLIVLISDKQAFKTDSPLTNYKESFVKFLHQKLYESMYASYPKLKIVEDEYGSSEFQKGFRKYVDEHRPVLNLFNEYDFDYTDSRNSNIVQIADIVAGSVMQHIIDSDSPDVLKIFQSKIVDIINFPKLHIDYVSGKNADKSFDRQIYFLADRCATNYIDKNMNSDDENIRIRVLFLRELLFTVRNISSSLFINSGKITKLLSSLSKKHINKNYLRRTIVAPLRDEDILIASSSKGYKIPTCISDIYAYINHTSSIVDPMLSRIGKCRSQIIKETDGALDILDDKTLLKYKRYFGDY
ncbi:MAG: DUF3800 domain-containing protein [Clostridia bacterium]|nr:DUF3800 domain-containing protein [Clostridia bacterium]